MALEMMNKVAFRKICFAVLLVMYGFRVEAMFYPRPNVMTTADLHQVHLCDAAKEGVVRTVISSLAHGADVNTRDVYGRCPLALAAGSGRLSMVQLLLAAGARPDDIYQELAD